jgi:hypothetical protein
MSDALLVAFLVAHGLVHLAIWLPHPTPDPAKPPPFEPGHSAVLTRASVSPPTIEHVAFALTWATAAAYVVAAVGVAVGAPWAVPALAGAALAGLALKAVFFHPWLSIGVVLDVLVLTSALAGWPVSLP